MTNGSRSTEKPTNLDSAATTKTTTAETATVMAETTTTTKTKIFSVSLTVRYRTASATTFSGDNRVLTGLVATSYTRSRRRHLRQYQSTGSKHARLHTTKIQCLTPLSPALGSNLNLIIRTTLSRSNSFSLSNNKYLIKP